MLLSFFYPLSLPKTALFLFEKGNLHKKKPGRFITFRDSCFLLLMAFSQDSQIVRHPILISLFCSCGHELLLSSRLYCRYRNSHSVMPSQTSHQFSRIICGSRTIPPVGTCTLPRRLNSFYSYYYSALLIKMQPLLLIFNSIFVLKSISPTALSTNMLIFLLSY